MTTHASRKGSEKGVLRRACRRFLEGFLQGVLQWVLNGGGFSEGGWEKGVLRRGLPEGTQKAETRPFVEYDPLGVDPTSTGLFLQTDQPNSFRKSSFLMILSTVYTQTASEHWRLAVLHFCSAVWGFPLGD